jgi:hypothetical protein
MVLSASSISQYLRCHHAYLLGTVYRTPRRESLRMLLGTAVHAGIESMLRGGEPEPALLSAWDEGIGRVDPAEMLADPDALHDAKQMPHVYRAEVMPTFHPDIVEAGFAVIPKGLGVTITGTIDAAESATDDLRDHKTTAGKTVNGVKPHFSPESYDLQGGLYRLGYYGLTGRWPRTYRLDVLTRRGTYRQYERTPSTSDALDMAAIVRDGINGQDYEPTGATSGQCSWCEYRLRCAHARID